MRPTTIFNISDSTAQSLSDLIETGDLYSRSLHLRPRDLGEKMALWHSRALTNWRADCSHENWEDRVVYHLDQILRDESRLELFDHDAEMEFIEDYGDVDVIFPLKLRRKPTTYGNTLVDIFLECISTYEMYPPPEIMLALAEMFQTYLAAEGQETLEDVLFGKPKKGVGNYAARKGFNIYGMFEAFRIQDEYKDMPLAEVAEIYLRNETILRSNSAGRPIDMDVDTFLRGRRRFNSKLQAQSNEDADNQDS